MYKRIQQLWEAALLSGDYQQTTKCLRDKEGHCCLGVLTDLFDKETGNGEWVVREEFYGYKSSRSGLVDGAMLPPAVATWAGLDCPHSTVTINGQDHTLAQHNDGLDTDVKTFEQIAIATRQLIGHDGLGG